MQKMLNSSPFPFSKRMYNMFEFIEVRTIGELCAISLKDFQCFRGFKEQCRNELIAFIEFRDNRVFVKHIVTHAEYDKLCKKYAQEAD